MSILTSVRIIRALEDYWFDKTRSVQTSKFAALEGFHLAGNRRDSFMYVPARVKRARELLRTLPVSDYRNYRFIDVGSGAGRILFLASEYPFRKIEGVELATELHQIAEQNIGCFQFYRQRCHDIQSVNVSAADYHFPDENLVIYMFNPFGAEIMRDVVNHLDASLRARPRSVIVAMLYPEYAHLMDGAKELRLYRSTARSRIYISNT